MLLFFSPNFLSVFEHYNSKASKGITAVGLGVFLCQLESYSNILKKKISNKCLNHIKIK